MNSHPAHWETCRREWGRLTEVTIRTLKLRALSSASLSIKSDVRHLLPPDQWLANIFWKSSNNKEFLLCGPYNFCFQLFSSAAAVSNQLLIDDTDTNERDFAPINLYLWKQLVGQLSLADSCCRGLKTMDLKGLPYHPQAAYFYPLSRVPADSSSHMASLLSTKPFLLQTRLSFETKVCILLISVPSKLTKLTVWQVLTNCLLSE